MAGSEPFPPAKLRFHFVFEQKDPSGSGTSRAMNHTNERGVVMSIHILHREPWFQIGGFEAAHSSLQKLGIVTSAQARETK